MDHLKLLRRSGRAAGETTDDGYFVAAPFASDVGVVMLHDELGPGTSHARDCAHLIASYGFHVLVPSLFGAGGAPFTAGQRRSQWAAQYPREAVMARVGAALTALRGRVALRAVAAVGFGYGGEQAVHLSTAAEELPFDACAAFYPHRLEDISAINSRRLPLLLLCGEFDMVTGEMFTELLDERIAQLLPTMPQTARVRLNTFYDQGHGFCDQDITDEYIAVKAYNTLADWLLCEMRLVTAMDVAPWSPDEIADCPTEAMWWPEGNRSVFHNVGYDTWTRTRATWRLHRRPRPPPAPLADEHQLMMLFASNKIQRLVELPGRVSLSQMVSVLSEVWEESEV